MTTNPNDIIDAYNELHRLADIIGTDQITELWSRVRAEQALQRPAPLAVVPEPEPVKVGLTSAPITVTINTDADPLDLAATVLEHAKPELTSGDGCPWCAADVRPRQLWRHVNTSHRSDLEEVYAEDGTKGLMETFGIGYQTAYGWGQRLEGEAA